MSKTSVVQRDERTVAVENAGYRWALILVLFSLLIDVIYRGRIRHEAAWDLVALVIGGSAVSTIYNIRKKAMPEGRAWMVQALVLTLISGVVGAAVVVALKAWQHI